MLLKLIDLASEIRDSEEEPVEDEGGGEQDAIALALEGGFLVAEMLGWGAGMLLVARRPSLVLPVNVHEEKEAEGDDGEEWLEDGADDGNEALAKATDAGEGDEEEHYRLRRRGVAEHHPLQRHGCESRTGNAGK